MAWFTVLVFSLVGLSADAQEERDPTEETPVTTSAKSVDAALGAAEPAARAAGTARSVTDVGRLQAEKIAETTAEAAEAESETEAQEEERAALERVEEARRLEERERNEALRDLRRQERELAERSLKATRQHHDRIAEIRDETRRNLEALAQEKSTLLDALDAVPPEVGESRRREEVDPLFDSVLELRSEAHDQFRGALDSVNEAEAKLAELTDAFEQEERQYARARGRLDTLDASQLWERRVAVAKAEYDLARERLVQQREILAAYRERVRDYHSQFGFFAGTIEPMLERISEDRRDAYFDVGDSANWEMAIEALGTGVRALEERVEHRLEQLDTSDLGTLEFWAWLWRLVWTLAGFLLIGYVGIQLAIWLLDRFCAALLRRRLLRRQVTVLVKLAEILRAISRPTLWYIGIAYTADYAAQSIPELLGLVWIVDAVFIYWVVMQASRVAVFPRSHRREEGDVSAEELDYLDEARADNVADIVGVDLARAKKLLNSIRVVTVFWLFAAYLPDFLKPLTGITVLWKLLDWAATWGVIVIVYWVLSRWRDEIAALFGKIAGERLAPAVEFVNRHKSRPWGVLVIGVTSLYVLVKEIVIIVRRYLLETNIFKQLNALAFRTQIELQNRSREASATALDPRERLSADFLAFFEEHPLDDEPYLIERAAEPEVTQLFAAWQDDRRRGSVAITGETGVGKTTLLNRLDAAMASADFEIVRHTFESRMTERAAAMAFLAELFELEAVPADLPTLVDEIRACDARVIVLDDCQLSFGRHIEQFGAIDALLEVVQLCDSQHFWVLAFSRHAWRYIDRVEDRGHAFGEVFDLGAWSPEDLQLMIERRNQASGYSVSFANLVAAHADTGDEEEESFDVIETSRGYFGYLHQFSGGIPRVALLYWLESLHPSTREGVLDVDLFERPETAGYGHFSDDYWFILAALVQHDGLTPREVSVIMDRPLGFCTRAFDFFADGGVVDIDEQGRARLSARHWRLVMRRLQTSNFIYGG